MERLRVVPADRERPGDRRRPDKVEDEESIRHL